MSGAGLAQAEHTHASGNVGFHHSIVTVQGLVLEAGVGARIKPLDSTQIKGQGFLCLSLVGGSGAGRTGSLTSAEP